MSEEPQDIKIPVTESPEATAQPVESVEPAEYLGPVSPAHREAAKRLLETEVTEGTVVTEESHRQLANALFQAESKAGARIGPLVAELDELKYDPITKLLMRGPGEKQAMELIDKLKQREAEGPTAIMCLMVDIKGLHDYNQEHGHKLGDLLISGAAKELEVVANLLGLILRTHDDQRKSTEGPAGEERRQSDRRKDRNRDIIWRRGGDEFVVIMPFRESERVDNDLLYEIIDERLNYAKDYTTADVPPIRWGASFYNPDGQSDMSAKQILDGLEDQADPKGDGESSRGAKAA